MSCSTRCVRLRTTGRQARRATRRAAHSRAKKRGADEALREDIAMRKAVDLIVEAAADPDRAGPGARGPLDTREGGRPSEPAKQIWTPGS